LLKPLVVFAVENPSAIDEHAVHAYRVPDRARAAARQVIEPAQRRNANLGGIEQQQIGMRADRDASRSGMP
jgi:hypothetical protein